MKYRIAAILAFSPASAWGQPCPPPGWDRAALTQLRAAGFEIAQADRREAFARAIAACLASPDPALRDGVAYEALARMLRAGSVSADTRIALARDLLARLDSGDPAGFGPPFAALVLAEIVRADGIDRYLPDPLRDAIVDAAVRYLGTVRDYRGFDAREGWRHGVAHGADLAMQIARNRNVADRARLERLRDAVAAQVAPAGHFYIYGEPERLTAPIVMIARRGVFSEAEWSDWFARLARPDPLPSWGDAFQSQEGLARRHNLRAFLQSIWLNARLSSDETDDVLLAGAEAALRAMS